MNPPSLCFLVHGTDKPPEPPRRLRAGPLTLDYDNGDLRAVKFGEREVIRRIYGAVRDQNWITVPFEILDLQVAASDESFRLTFKSEHRLREIHFVWRAEITGDEHGTIRFAFDGEAKSTFLRNRIGLCVLHPIRECAGAKCRALYQDGRVENLTFPVNVAPEQPVNGFKNLAGLTHEIAPGHWAELRFEGDIFETEDQRNWIDASFKTFSTPLKLPRPIEVKAGTRIFQRVEMSLHHESQVQRGSERYSSERVAVNIESMSPFVRMPKIGLGESDHGHAIEGTELARLSGLNLNHLRAEVKLDEVQWRARLLAATRSANALNIPLELAVYLPANSRIDELSELRNEIAQLHKGVSRIFAFQTGCTTTTSTAFRLLREHLGGFSPIGVGTDADLYQLQLQPPPMEGDFICWTMNPQVHASDSRSIAETPEASAQQVATIGQSFPGKPLVISPITLKPRFNPVASGSEPPAASDELPSSVDLRQMTLFCAAWTVGMLSSLGPSGVESITFFETIGWRGVLENPQGSRLPDKFPSFPGGVFPVWHAFAALSGSREVAAVPVSDPQRVAALTVIQQGGAKRLVLANLTPNCVEVTFSSRGGIGRVLDESNVADAMREPERWWGEPGKPITSFIRLSAYAVAFVDLS